MKIDGELLCRKLIRNSFKNRNLKSDEWILRSNELRKLFEEKFDLLAKSSNPLKNLNEYSEKSIEKEVRLACGKFNPTSQSFLHEYLIIKFS